MNGPLFALERWAQARPARRFPLLLLALLILAGCAGPHIYATPSEQCSPATDSIAEQIGSPHRTCKP